MKGIVFEKFVPITEDIVPNIQPWYYISNFGTIKSSYSNKELKPFMFPKTGYLHIGLRLQGNTFKHYLVHRLVMQTFCPIPNQNEYEVNHIDGNKLNNCLYNLEWVTRNENIAHAWTNNLYKSGEEHHNANLTNDQVNTICKGLEKHLAYTEIANNIKLTLTPLLSSTISDIKNGRRWTSISKQYTFTDERSFQLFSNEEIHHICKMMEKGFSNIEILNSINNHDENYKGKLTSIQAIRRRDKFKNISKDYDF